MEYPDPEEEIEEQIESQVERQNEAQEEYLEDNSPSYEKPETLYSLFRDVIRMKDFTKLGNLNKVELGMLTISVRDLQYISMTALILGEISFASWLSEQSQIILKTSVAKNGWQQELFVTAKRFASKEKRFGIPEGTQPGIGSDQQPKKSWWKRVTGR